MDKIDETDSPTMSVASSGGGENNDEMSKANVDNINADVPSGDALSSSLTSKSTAAPNPKRLPRKTSSSISNRNIYIQKQSSRVSASSRNSLTLGDGFGTSPSMREWNVKDATMRHRRRHWSGHQNRNTRFANNKNNIVEHTDDGISVASDRTVYDMDDIVFQPCCGAPWTFGRLRHTGLFCISSCVVLGIRLWLDSSPSAYLIHSIVVFLDMILIHLFTHSLWLSLSGELVTILSVLAFTLTKETIYELLETTFIAILCSFHMIASRNKHKEREDELEEGVANLRHQTYYMLQDEENPKASMRQIHRQTSLLLHDIDALQDFIIDEDEEHQTSSMDMNDRVFVHQPARKNPTPIEGNGALQQPTILTPQESLRNLQSWFIPPTDMPKSEGDTEESENCKRARVWGENFFEHFLDGSAGVMYTSFLGLIIDEIVKNYTESDKCY